MKQPKLIYTYSEAHNTRCNIKEYYLSVYKPSEYTKDAKYMLSFATKLFDIHAQSNTETEQHSKGIHKAYAIRIQDMEFGNAEAFNIASKVGKDVYKDGGLPTVIKRLRKLGAVRFALGTVEKSGRTDREFMPRRYANKSKSVAYWNAIVAGLELPC